MKRYILLFGALGLAGCFLPLAGHLTLFDLRHFRFAAWLVVGAFALPAIVAWRGSAAATVLAGIVGFGYLGAKLGPRALDLVLHAGIGGKLIGVAVVGGALATIGALVEHRSVRA